MRRLLTLALFVCLLTPLAAARERAYGFCSPGAQQVYVGGIASRDRTPPFSFSYWLRSYPSCTVTVYFTGTTTPVSLYSDNSGTPLSNPFTASSNGYWKFYADNGRYDVVMSGAGFASPFTLGDILLCDACGGGGGGSSAVATTTNQAGLPADGAGTEGTLYNLTDAWRGLGEYKNGTARAISADLNVKDFGARGDGGAYQAVSCASGSGTLSSVAIGNNGRLPKVGDNIVVSGCGAAGADLVGVVSGGTATTGTQFGTVTLSGGLTAGATLSNRGGRWGPAVNVDDTPAFSAAITYCATVNANSVNQGCRIRVPAGVYFVSNLTFPTANGAGGGSMVSLYGIGRGSTLIEGIGADHTALLTAPANSVPTDVQFIGFTNYDPLNARQSAMQWKGGTEHTFNNNYVFSMYQGVSAANTWINLISNNRFYSLSGNCIEFGGAAGTGPVNETTYGPNECAIWGSTSPAIYTHTNSASFGNHFLISAEDDNPPFGPIADMSDNSSTIVFQYLETTPRSTPGDYDMIFRGNFNTEIHSPNGFYCTNIVGSNYSLFGDISGTNGCATGTAINITNPNSVNVFYGLGPNRVTGDNGLNDYPDSLSGQPAQKIASIKNYRYQIGSAYDINQGRVDIANTPIARAGSTTANNSAMCPRNPDLNTTAVVPYGMLVFNKDWNPANVFENNMGWVCNNSPNCTTSPAPVCSEWVMWGQTSTKIRAEGTAAPASGTWSVGNFIWNTNPASNGILGWLCTTAGTPGTWTTVAAINFPPSGIPVSTGSAWGVSKASPAGVIVGDTDAQLLQNKSIDGTNTVTNYIDMTQVAAPANPAAGKIRVYGKTGTQLLCSRDPSGVESCVGGAGGSGLGDPGGNGIVARTALNTTINRTITGTANHVTVTNGDGVAGNPTLDTGANVPLMAANGGAGNLVQTAAADKNLSDSAIPVANVVTAASNFVNTGLVKAAGANKTLASADLGGAVVTSGSTTVTMGKRDLSDANTFCADAGVSDTYACNLSPAITAYVTGTHYRFKANTANTGAASINFNSVGAATIKKAVGGITTDLADNDIRAGQWVEVVYDGTNMQMVSMLANSTSGSVTGNSTSNAHAVGIYQAAGGSTIINADTNCFTDAAGQMTCSGFTVSGSASADGWTAQNDPAITTVASLGTPTNGLNKIVTDGSTASDCVVGGGSNKNWCQGNGSSWIFKLAATDAVWLSSTVSPNAWAYYNGSAIKYFLTTESTITASPAGSDTQVQYNNSGSLGASAGFVFDKTSKVTLGVAGASVGTVVVNNATSGSITVQPVTGALGSVTLSLPARTATVATNTGTLTNGNLVSFDASGNGVDSGTASANVVTAASAATGAKQICTASGASKTCSYIDFPEHQEVIAANCNNATAGAALDIPASNAPTVACRAGTNNLGGVLQWANNNTTTNAQFTFQLPNDWDTATQPYINIYYGSGANTSGTVKWTFSTSCTKADGSVTDDGTFNAESTTSGKTMAAANRMWAESVQFTTLTSGNNCVAGSSVIVKITSGNGTATSSVNVAKISLTIPRLLAVQAN